MVLNAIFLFLDNCTSQTWARKLQGEKENHCAVLAETDPGYVLLRASAHKLASFVRRRLSFITSPHLSLLCLLIVDELSHKFFSFFLRHPTELTIDLCHHNELLSSLLQIRIGWLSSQSGASIFQESFCLSLSHLLLDPTTIYLRTIIWTEEAT